MLNAIINFEVILNIALILLVVCLSCYIAVQGQRLRRYEQRTEKMHLRLRWVERKQALEKQRLAA